MTPLALQLAAAADTLIVRNVPPVRTAFEQVAFVASGLTSILLLLMVAVLLVALVALKAKADAVQAKLEELLTELRPMTRSANAMAEDVRAVAQDVKAMVNESKDTVTEVNQRVRRSVTTLTDRVDDLSALIGRVNDSAERVAKVATTTVAGIKAGARVLGLAKAAKKKRKAVAREDDDERPRLRRRG